MARINDNALGIDPGSRNTAVAIDNTIIYREASAVLITREKTVEVIAAGKEAKSLEGRTPEGCTLSMPISDGAVADAELAALMIVAAVEKATGRRKQLEKSPVAVSMPHGATRVEREALKQCLAATGARHAVIVKAPVAAAIGMNLDVDKAHARLIISIGACRSEVAVLFMGGIAACRSIRTGSEAFTDAIIRYIRRSKQLVITRETSEEIKMDMGRASRPDRPNLQQVTIRGRNSVTGKPGTAQIDEGDVYLAINGCVEDILDAIKDSLINMPVELVNDILESGLFLTGGGVMLAGMADALREATALPVTLSPHPQDDTALGLQAVASDDALVRLLIRNDSAYEV